MKPSPKCVQPPGSAKAQGPYSPALDLGDFVFISGQIGLDPATSKVVLGGTLAEFEQALKNIRTLLEAAGLTPAQVVKTTLFLTDMGEFAALNEAYASFFQDLPRPARSTIQVAALPGGARIEIEAIARR